MTFVECSHDLRAGIEWRQHVFSAEASLTQLGLELEPRWRSAADLRENWLEVEVNADTVSWQWPRSSGADRVEYVGANAQQGVVRRTPLSARGSVQWSSVGTGVELTLLNDGAATATLYVARPRMGAADFTVERYAGRLHVQGAWPEKGPLPRLLLHERTGEGGIDRRAAEKGRFEFVRKRQIAATVSPLPRGSRILVVAGETGDLIYWCRVNERGELLDQPSEVRPLVESLYTSQHQIVQVPWPRRTRMRLAALTTQLAHGPHAALAQHLAGHSGANLIRTYRIAILDLLGITIDRNSAALSEAEFTSALSGLLSRLDVSGWQRDAILWALRSRSHVHFAAVAEEHGNDPLRMQRALAVWDELLRARILLKRSPQSAEVHGYIEGIEGHILRGDPLPESAELRQWRAANWLQRLHRLLLWWKQGSEPREASGDRAEVLHLLQTIERPPRVEGGVADSSLAIAARELVDDDSADLQDPVAKLALAKLNEDVIPAAENCARFHAYIHSVGQDTAPFAFLAAQYPVDSDRSMADRFRNAAARVAAVADAEKEAVHLVALRADLQAESLLDVLMTPGHPAVERVVASKRAGLEDVRDLLVAYDVDFEWPSALATSLHQWWAALKQLEFLLRTTAVQMKRLEMIRASVWISLRPHVEQAKSRGFSPPEVEALAARCQSGDLQAPRQLCELLAAMPLWPRILAELPATTSGRRKRRR